MTPSDLDLVNEYAQSHSEAAFGALLTRHLALVYSAALRQVRSPQLAEEVTQSVFIDLARHIARLNADTILSAWLYRVTRSTAIDVIRQESRRQRREQVALELALMKSDAAEWSHLEPLLDEAMHALEETDRTAVLLRFFENRTLREVGQFLGTSEDAAQKRVSRALERLREFFGKRGLRVSTASLAVLLSANAISAAPVGLGSAILGITFGGAAAQVTVGAELTKTIAMTTLQKTLLAATVALGLGTGLYQAQRSSGLQRKMTALEQQQAPLTQEMAQLRQQSEASGAKVAELEEENARLRENTAELAKLRGQVQRLKGDSRQLEQMKGNEPFVQDALNWREKENRLRRLLAEKPEQGIPEMQQLSAETWLDIARNADLDSEVGVRKALSRLRFVAENQFVPRMQAALRKYADANDGTLPADLFQLKPFFEPETDDATLKRYKMNYPGVKVSAVPANDWVVTQTGVVDGEYDSRWHIGANWYGPVEFKMSELQEVVQPALNAFRSAHHGQSPKEINLIVPYLKTPEQQAAYQSLIDLVRSKQQ